MLAEKKYPSSGVLKESYSETNNKMNSVSTAATSRNNVTDEFYQTHTLYKTSSNVKQILFNLIPCMALFYLHLKGISANIHVLFGHPMTVAKRISRICNLGSPDLFL